MGERGFRCSPSGGSRVSVSPDEAASLLLRDGNNEKPEIEANLSGRKRPASQWTEVMICSLCEQKAIFEHDYINDELSCTCCGAIIDAMSDMSHRPFKLPMPMHLYVSTDFSGSMMSTDCQPPISGATEKEAATRRSPTILEAAVTNQRLVMTKTPDKFELLAPKADR